MILDTLEQAARYSALKPGLSEGFRFLNRPDIAELKPGKYEISGDQIFAIVEKNEGRNVAAGQLEAHRNYLDIQYIISGDETMGWCPLSELTHASNGYEAERDLEFFEGSPQALVKVPPGSFTIFLPTDAHLPGIGTGPIHKIVVKVALNESEG
ncbi:MAG: YhcH/YjgK/YiaL family protein [Pontiella sp.]